MSDLPRVFLGMPTYNHLAHLHAAVSFASASKGSCLVFRAESKSSLLPDAFNSLWTDALNMRSKHGFTYFAMLHTDIAPAPGWIDVLLSELQRTGSDLVSAVVPIADGRGVTSTAIDDPNDPWTPLRRLTLKEVYDLPFETFDAALAGYRGHKILVNTGCWICRIDRPWCEACDKVYFDIRTRIIRLADGRFERQVIPEDWFFSRAVQDLGGKVMATRKVKLKHHGQMAYPNDASWGTWQEDEKRRNLEPVLSAIRNGHQQATAQAACA